MGRSWPEDEDSCVWNGHETDAAFRSLVRWECALDANSESSATIVEMTGALEHGARPLAVAALATAEDRGTTNVLALAEREQWRATARGLIAGNSLGWNAEPLVFALANSGAMANREALPNHLLAQFAADDIPGNASAAARIYLIGTQEDARRFVAPLLAHWREMQRAGDAPETQEVLVPAYLALAWALDDPDSWRDHKNWMSLEHDVALSLDDFDTLSRGDKDTLLRIAVSCTDQTNYYRATGDMEGFARDARHLGWSLLENCDPFPAEEFRAIARDEVRTREDRHRAVTNFIPSNVELLLSPAYDELFPILIAHAGDMDDAEEWGKALRADLELPQCIMDAGGELEDSDHSAGIAVDIPWSWGGRALLEIRRHREALLSLLRGALEREREPWPQLRLCAALVAAKDEESMVRVGDTLAAHLIDDDVSENAEAAERLLDRMGDVANDVARSGIDIGVERGDWQLVGRCASILESDGDWDPTENVGALTLMAEQLRNDDVQGNAIAAEQFFWSCPRWLRRVVLLPMVGMGDEQFDRSAGELIE